MKQPPFLNFLFSLPFLSLNKNNRKYEAFSKEPRYFVFSSPEDRVSPIETYLPHSHIVNIVLLHDYHQFRTVTLQVVDSQFFKHINLENDMKRIEDTSTRVVFLTLSKDKCLLLSSKKVNRSGSSSRNPRIINFCLFSSLLYRGWSDNCFSCSQFYTIEDTQLIKKMLTSN